MKQHPKLKAWLLGIYFLLFVVYLSWRLFYTLPLKYGIPSIVFGILLFIAESVGFLESIFFYATVYNPETLKTPKIESNISFPHVDVFIATYNESLSLLYKTIVACKNMKYPVKNKVHIYVCDDGNRSGLEKMCQRLQVGYITRIDHAHAKAGNINHALSVTDSPLFVTFDADMIPMSDFLMSTIPFFLKDENVGFVQVPQNFYNADPFQYNLFLETRIPNEQTLFSRLIQAGRSRYNAIIYAGSNTVLSRKAVLEVGGFVTGTITEDFATGLEIQRRGYKSIYLNEIHASGLSPESLSDLYNQRIRWGRGVVQTFKRHNPLFKRDLTFMQKLLYFSSLSYWYFGLWRFIYLLSPIVFSVFGVTVLHASMLQILCFWLPFYVTSYIVFQVFAQGVRTTIWGNIYDTIMFPQIILGVLMETFGMKLAKFKVTPKDKVVENTYVNSYRLVIAQIGLLILSVIGVIHNVVVIVSSHVALSAYLINLFWLIYNGYLLTVAVFFASERPKFRVTDRLIAKEPVVVRVGDRVFQGFTNDISETGLSITFDHLVYIEPDELCQVVISAKGYHCELNARLVFTNLYRSTHRCSFVITSLDEQNHQQLLYIMHDRVPAAAEIVESKSNVIHYLKNRRKKFVRMQRKYPRVELNQTFAARIQDTRASVFLYDLDFYFCRVKRESSLVDAQVLVIFFTFAGKELGLQCELDIALSSRRPDSLIYRIQNSDDVIRLLTGPNAVHKNTEVPKELLATLSEVAVAKGTES